MDIKTKIRHIINPRLREIYTTIGGTLSMGDLAVYVGQPMQDAMEELAGFISGHERQRAVEICDLNLERMIDREIAARAIRDPKSIYPSQGK